MNLGLDTIIEKLEQNDFIKNFMNELSEALEKFNNENELKGEKMENTKLTQEEDMEFYRKKWDFLENYFNKELSDLSKGEIFIVTNKYENDYEYHRYKVTQYKDHKECKYIAFEKDLPENLYCSFQKRGNRYQEFSCFSNTVPPCWDDIRPPPQSSGSLRAFRCRPHDCRSAHRRPPQWKRRLSPPHISKCSSAPYSGPFNLYV